MMAVNKAFYVFENYDKDKISVNVKTMPQH